MKINRIIFGIIFSIIIINISISASLSYDNFVHDQTILSLSSSSSVSQSSFSLDDQWNLGLVGARKAHSAGFDGTNASNPNDPVVVAVLDSGVYNHTELQSSFVNSTDFTGEGTQDDTAHGTHVSGIIASNVRGVAPAAKIYSFKVIGSGGSGLVSWLINALNDLSKNHPPIKGGTDGVDIVTMSLGVLPSELEEIPKQQLQQAVNGCLDVGMILVAASGNYENSPDGINYPAAFPGVICVGAIDKYQTLTSYSEYGDKVDFVAPGGDQTGQIYSTFPAVNGSYGYMMGTSQATPHIAGVIAVLLGKNSTIYNNNTIHQKLRELCKDLGAPGWDQFYGYGLPQLYPEDNYFSYFILILVISAIAGVIVVIIPGRKE